MRPLLAAVEEACVQADGDRKLLERSNYSDHPLVHGDRLRLEAELIDKPFTAQTLVRKVREVLDARRS